MKIIVLFLSLLSLTATFAQDEKSPLETSTIDVFSRLTIKYNFNTSVELISESNFSSKDQVKLRKALSPLTSYHNYYQAVTNEEVVLVFTDEKTFKNKVGGITDGDYLLIPADKSMLNRIIVYIRLENATAVDNILLKEGIIERVDKTPKSHWGRSPHSKNAGKKPALIHGPY